MTTHPDGLESGHVTHLNTKQIMATKTKTTVKKKITFEDRGQDFLWFIIDGETVLDCGGFQKWCWGGLKVINPNLKVGDKIILDRGDSNWMTLAYPIIKIEILDESTSEES